MLIVVEPTGIVIPFEHPGLHRTLLGDGFATILASLFGAPANTTYGENTGVLALSKVYDPRVIRIAAYFAVVFSILFLFIIVHFENIIITR